MSGLPVNRLAPAAAAIAIGVMWWFGGYRIEPPRGVSGYFAAVSRSLDALPYKVGPWIGADTEVQEAAVRLLNPNKLIQRVYTDPATGRTVQVLVVHCGETRDMVGHFPPVCYPAHGWVQEEALPAEVRIDDVVSPATQYRFRRTLQGLQSEMVITNFFVLPGEGLQTAADIGSLDQASQSPLQAALGAAQVQIVTEAQLRSDERAAIVDLFAAALEPSLRVVAGGGAGAH